MIDQILDDARLKIEKLQAINEENKQKLAPAFADVNNKLSIVSRADSALKEIKFFIQVAHSPTALLKLKCEYIGYAQRTDQEVYLPDDYIFKAFRLCMEDIAAKAIELALQDAQATIDEEPK